MASDPLKAALIERAKREKARRSSAPAATSAPAADMSMMGRIRDNVVGVDDGVQSFGENLATALNIGGESMSLGLIGDEAAAATDTVMGRGTYDDRLAARRKQEEDFKQANPKTAFAAEMAPMLIPGAGGAKIAASLGSRLGRAGAGAAMGAGAAGVYGFAEGEGDDRAQNAAISAALGGIVGGVTPRVIDGLAKVPAGVKNLFKASQKRPTIETLKATKNLAYRAVDESGEAFTPEDISGLAQRASAAFEAGNYVEEVDNAGRAVLKTLEARASQPSTTLSQLDGIRQSLWKRYANAKDQPFILDAIKEIDDLIETKSGASELMATARAANSRYAKSQLLDDAFTRAQDQTAATGSGGNIVNKYRQAVTSIINNPKKAKFFKPEEIDVMRQFVRGSMSENAKRLIGKLSPSGNGLMMALHVVGGVSSQGATLPLMAVGAAAKQSADTGVEKGAAAIQDMISGFRPAPVAPRLTGPAAIGVTAASPLLEDQSQALQRGLGLLQ